MKKGVSQSMLSIFLASMLLLGTIMIASNSNGNTMMMITMQSAEADVSDVFNPIQVNSCDQFGAGVDLSNCQNNVNSDVETVTQVPPTGTSNLFNTILTSNQLNDCDEFDAGNNEAFCSNDADYFVGPSQQTNNPSNNPVGSNVVTIVRDDDMVNNCDESGASGGTNFADCQNEVDTQVGDATSGIEQLNFAIATDNLDNPNFAEDNNVDIFQRVDLLNTCNELQVPAVNNFCGNDADNFIGPVEQSNTVIGDIPEQPHTNNFAASQIVIQQNDCDESGSGASTKLVCDNGPKQENGIGSVDQENTATNTDNAVQTNDATSLQSVDSNNDCNESDDGDNTALCNTDGENSIGQLDQSNSALGAAGATIFQNNEIDGNDVGDIPGINQVITADNTCDEEGVGTNFALCDLTSLDNQVQEVNQANVINEADDATDIFQDNRNVISQVIDADNDCDETGIGGGNNVALCVIQKSVDIFLGIVSQDNEATGNDNSLFDQDNNLDVSQVLLAENDCNATGNSAFCKIGFPGLPDMNYIASISQGSFSQLIDVAFSNQLNEVSIDQNTDLVNTCDESGTGLHAGACINQDIQNFVGPISQSNDATGADSAVISETSNKVGIIQNLQATNDCDESNAGANLADCENDAFNTIDSIKQTNTAIGLGADDIDQDNFVSINQNLQTKNDCDESGDGDNNGICENLATNSIESIIQTNGADGDGDDIIDQDNILAINQNLVTENDCDEFGLGDNLVSCSINISNEIGNIVQENTDSDTGSANSLTINQDLQAKNNCDDSTSGDNTKICSINLHLEVPDITQTDGEVLTINQNDFAINTCPGGGTCNIDRTTTFVPLSFSTLKLPTEEPEGSVTTASASFVQEAEADATESQSSPLNNEGDDDDGDNSSPSGNNDNNNVDTSAKLSAAETETSINNEEQQQQDETDGALEAEPEEDDTGNENQNNNNNNDGDGNDNDNDNDDNQSNTNNNNNNNDNDGGEEEEEEEEEAEPEEDEPEEGGDEGEDGE